MKLDYFEIVLQRLKKTIPHEIAGEVTCHRRNR